MYVCLLCLLDVIMLALVFKFYMNMNMNFLQHHLIRLLTESVSAFRVLSAQRGRIFYAATSFATRAKRHKILQRSRNDRKSITKAL